MSRRRRSALPGAAALLAALVAGAVAPGQARADTVDARATTLLAGRPDPRDGEVHTALPVTELVSLRATDVKNPLLDDLAIVLSTWGQLDPGDPPDARTADGDVDLGYLEGKAWKRRVLLRVGRQLVAGGAARIVQLDGASALVRPWRPLGVHVYGGSPVTPRFAVDRGDSMVGGRLSLRRSIDAEAGVSFVHVREDGRIARQDAGVDGRWVLPGLPVTLGAWALWSIPEARLAEGDVGATWSPGRRLQLTLDYRRTAPDLFLPRSSVLSVFSQEARDEAGGWLSLRPGARVRVDGDWHAIRDAAGWGQQGGARLSWTPFRDRRTTVAPELRVLDVADNGYLQARVHARHRVNPRVLAAVDADAYFFDDPINGQDVSFTASATAGWQLDPDWHVLVTGLGGATPFFETRVEVMAKIAWHHTLHLRAVSP